jgi:hypothetical protein
VGRPPRVTRPNFPPVLRTKDVKLVDVSFAPIEEQLDTTVPYTIDNPTREMDPEECGGSAPTAPLAPGRDRPRRRRRG